MKLEDLLFWQWKTQSDNDWHPRPGENPVEFVANLPSWLRRIDPEAMAVDVAPFICGAGGIAHLRQINSLGWTAPISVFRNTRTMMAMQRTSIILPAIVLLCQAAGYEYRNFIPRWSHDRERRRDEAEVREHVETGAFIGFGGWIVRMYLLRIGRAYPSPTLDTIMGGALADLLFREYWKAHGH